MLYEYFIGKTIDQLYKCEYCQYSGKPKKYEEIYCSKLNKNVVNDRGICKFNKMKFPTSEEK